MTSLPKASLLSLLLLLAALAPAAASAQKVAVVDITRAVQETEDGRKALAKLKKLTEKRQKALDGQKASLLKMKEDFERQASVFSPEVRAKKAQEFQKALADLQGKLMEFQRELASKEGELTKDILNQMNRIVRRMGQKNGYTLILDKQQGGVIFVPSNRDLTDELIQRYNAGEGKKK